MMVPWDRKVLILFILIAILTGILALLVYRMTGPMGIEERYNQAVGLPGTGREGSGGWFGLSLEGNPLAYGVILGSLLLLCLFVFFWRRRKGG
jgi:hypothetical protein